MSPRWYSQFQKIRDRCFESQATNITRSNRRDTPEVPQELPAPCLPEQQGVASLPSIHSCPWSWAQRPVPPSCTQPQGCGTSGIPVSLPHGTPFFLWGLSLAHWRRVDVPFLNSCFLPISAALCRGCRQTFKTYS